jgi:tRNA threonylcarbamoyladenosine biosynthesis protein TsaB
LILAVDTCLTACSVAVVEDGRVLAARSEPMERGHQERLGLITAEVMAGLAFADLQRIGATVGPGSFTGLRVGLAFAKGLGLALNKPVVGVGTLQALAFGEPGRAAAIVDARREQVYLQAFEDGAPLSEPEALSAVDAAARLATLGQGWRLVGTGGALVAGLLPGSNVVARTAPDPVAVARLVQTSSEPTRPLYLRAPDAKLPTA